MDAVAESEGTEKDIVRNHQIQPTMESDVENGGLTRDEATRPVTRDHNTLSSRLATFLQKT